MNLHNLVSDIGWTAAGIVAILAVFIIAAVISLARKGDEGTFEQ